MGDSAGRGGPAPPATIYGGALGEIDRAVYRAIAATPSPSLDFILSRLSSAADRSKLWFAIAAALALKPGRPQRAALLGVGSIGREISGLSRSVSNLGSSLGTAIAGTILVAGITKTPERAYGLAMIVLAAIGLLGLAVSALLPRTTAPADRRRAQALTPGHSALPSSSARASEITLTVSPALVRDGCRGGLGSDRKTAHPSGCKTTADHAPRPAHPMVAAAGSAPDEGNSR